jgi:hypothetical protein
MINQHGVKDSSYTIHPVPVFQKDLAAVFKLLSDRNPDQAPLGGLAAPTVASLEGSWSEADLVALLGLCKPVHRSILTRIAEAGIVQKSATYEELRVAGALASHNSDFDFDNMRGNLAWISKYMIKVTGSKTGLFVFTDKGPELSTGQRYEYRMPKTTADAWLRIARTV